MPTEFILNENEGVDVLHRAQGLTERCNTDQVKGRRNIDARTAAELLASGEAELCDHCRPPTEVSI